MRYCQHFWALEPLVFDTLNNFDLRGSKVMTISMMNSDETFGLRDETFGLRDETFGLRDELR